MSASQLQASLLARKEATGSLIDFTAVTVKAGGLTVPWSQRKSLLTGAKKECVVTVKEGQRSLMAGRKEVLMKYIVPEVDVTFGWKVTPEGVEWQGGRGMIPWMHELDHMRVARVEIPRNVERPEHKDVFVQAVRELLSAPGVCLGYVTEGKVVLVATDDRKAAWCGPWAEKGVRLLPGPKLEKRLSSLTRAYPVEGEMKGLTVKFVEGNETLLDGGFALRESTAKSLIETMSEGRVKDIARKCHTFNCRILLEDGMLKGNAILTADALMPEGVDVVSHETNLKKEIAGVKVPRIGLEPQPAKVGCRTSVQAMLALPQLFPEAEVASWIDSFFYQHYAAIKSGKVLDTWEGLYANGLYHEEEEIDSAMLWFREMCIRWVGEAGLTFLHSPTLTRRTFQAHKCSLSYEKGKQVKLTVPAPCSLNEQVISTSLAKLCGWKGEVADGSIIRWMGKGVHVVSDATWLDMVPSHGGCDQDDHFMLFYRTVAGVRSVVVLRNPCDVGEYSVLVFDARGGSDPESELWINGKPTKVRFPEVDLSGACKRRSEAIRDKSLVMHDMPPSEREWTSEYTRESVIDSLRHRLEGMSPGMAVNAKMLRNAAYGTQCAEMIASMETIIDTATQGGSLLQMQAILNCREGWLLDVKDANVPMDRTLWASRAPDSLDWQPMLVDGWLTRLLRRVDERYTKCAKLLEEWSHKNHIMPPLLDNHKPADPVLYKLIHGAVKDYGAAAKNVFTKCKDVKDEEARNKEWRMLYAALFDVVGAANVGSLAYYIHHKDPKWGPINDSPLWTREIFPAYLKAVKP